MRRRRLDPGAQCLHATGRGALDELDRHHLQIRTGPSTLQNRLIRHRVSIKSSALTSSKNSL